MKSWSRRTELTPRDARRRVEWWELFDGETREVSHPVDVWVGKALDIVGLKSQTVQDIRDYAAFVAKTSASLYAPDSPKRSVSHCPVCKNPAEDAALYVTIHGSAYVRCLRCGHCFIQPQPTAQRLREVFSNSEEHAEVYTDMASLETRMSQVIQPKIDWTAQAYRAFRGGEVSSLLDIGAGGGHFVAGARRCRIRADGYEVNKASRKFAQNVLGVELQDSDFLQQAPVRGRYDVITFWGLLEYTPDPGAFVRRAWQWLDPAKGMLVLEVPRIDCFGSEVQRAFPDTVARHLDPTSHMNCFSDASIATILHDNGFKPVAAWYFGMDVYELLSQTAIATGNDALIEQMASWISDLQIGMDGGHVCDDIVIAAVPA